MSKKLTVFITISSLDTIRPGAYSSPVPNWSPYMRSIQDANGTQIVSRWMWANPFAASGRYCVPLAWAHVAGMTAAGCVQLARRAQGEERGASRGVRLLDSKGSGYTSMRVDADRWAQLAGLAIRGEHHYGQITVFATKSFTRTKRPSLKTFLLTHPHGRYLVRVSRHAMAVINGVVYGFVPSPRVLVTDAYRVVKPRSRR